MKRDVFIVLLIGVALLFFSIGFFLGQPQKFDSCKSAYENVLESELCRGKNWGSGYVEGNVEYFDFNWESVGVYKQEEKTSIGGINPECYFQAQEQFIETGIRENLINCFADEIEIRNDILEIQCGCFFG